MTALFIFVPLSLWSLWINFGRNRQFKVIAYVLFVGVALHLVLFLSVAVLKFSTLGVCLIMVFDGILVLVLWCFGEKLFKKKV